MKKILLFLRCHWLMVCIVIACILRATYFIEISRIPFFENPVGDAKIYFDRAQEILAGTLFPEEVSFHSSPVYPYFLAATYAPLKSLAGPRIVQMLTGVMNCIIGYYIVLAIAGYGAACIAAFLMAVYPLFIYFEGDLMMIPLVLFTLNLSCLMLVLYAQRTKKRFLAATGILLGLSALGKPDIIMLCPFIALWIFFTEPSRKKALCRIGFLALWVCATILPCTITNYMLNREFMLLTSNGGVNFYIGNHHGANGMFHLPKESGLWDHRLYVSSKEVAEQTLQKPLTPGQVSRFWFEKGIAFAVHHPLEFIVLFLKKIMLMINQFEVSNHHSFYFFKKFSDTLTALPIRLNIILLFFAAGITALLPFKRSTYIPFLYLCVTFFTTAFFFVTSRYRLPSITFFILTASIGIERTYHFISAKKWKQLAEVMIPGIALFGLSLIPFSEYSPSLNQDYNNLGNVYMDLGDYEKALRCYQRNLAHGSGGHFTHFNIGNVYEKMGKIELAAAEFIQEMELNPSYEGSYIAIARLYMKKGDFNQSKYYLERLAQLKITYEGMFNLGYVYFHIGNIARAIETYENMLNVYPNDAQIKENLRLCYQAEKKQPE